MADFDDSRAPMGQKGSNIKQKIKEDIDQLYKDGQPTAADWKRLYQKYSNNDEIVDAEAKARFKKFNEIREKARSFAEKVHNKYVRGDLPLHKILERMAKYKTKHNWTQGQFDAFSKELTGLLSGQRAKEVDQNQMIAINRSRINKALGGVTQYYQQASEPGLNIKESDYGVVSEIIDLYNRNLSLYKSVFMHSLMYQDCSLVAMSGEFKRGKNIPSQHIHPVIACLFLPRFKVLDNFLQGNIGRIISDKYNKKAISNEPDSLLLWDIVSDPNDVVCDSASPMVDIRNRFKVQIALWKVVQALRSGYYYDGESITEFMQALSVCRNNLYDNADLSFSQDDGAMLRRLFSVFSFRPTFISSSPLVNVFEYMQGAVAGQMPGVDRYDNQDFTAPINLTPYTPNPQSTVTSIPLINISIPPMVEGQAPTPRDLRTSQSIWLYENKKYVPRQQNVISSKEILVFYVDRKVPKVQIQTYGNPIPFSQLPLTMNSFDKLNNYPVDVPQTITLGRSEEMYQLRSVVASTETQFQQGTTTTSIVTGSVGLIMTHRDLYSNQPTFNSSYFLYDPFGASLPVTGVDAAGQPYYFNNKPISMIEPIFTPLDNASGSKSWTDRASTEGSLYIYQNPRGFNARESIQLY